MEEIIKLKKNNSKENLTILKDFYVNVWAKFERYRENDVFLYVLFKNKKVSERIKIEILNKFYSAGMKDVQIYSFIENKKNLKLNTIGDFEYEYKNHKKTKLISLESKYLHWKDEVNGSKNSYPIYDSKVRNELKLYSLQSKLNYSDLKAKIDEFIKTYLGNEVRSFVDINEIDGLPKSISIYRLVDKFLWLNNKFRLLQAKVENKKNLNVNDEVLNKLFKNNL